jgi:hypothetical protein
MKAGETVRPKSAMWPPRSALYGRRPTNTKSANVSIPAVAAREHFAVIRWGTANGQHEIEIDVCRGNGVSIPAAAIEVEFFDESIRPSLNDEPVPRNYPSLSDSVSLGHFTRSGNGFRTRRMWQPFFLDAQIEPAILRDTIDSIVAVTQATRPIPPFAREATVICASWDTTVQVALIFLSRALDAVGVFLYSHAFANQFGVGRVPVPNAAEYVSIITSIAAPTAPAQQCDVFFVRFDLEF